MWFVCMCVRGKALSEQMDSLTLAQLQGLLARDFGLHIGNGEMFAEHTTIRFLVANRLVRPTAPMRVVIVALVPPTRAVHRVAPHTLACTHCSTRACPWISRSSRRRQR